MGTAIDTKIKSHPKIKILSEVLRRNQDLIFKSTPGGVNPAALIKKALFAIQSNYQLLKCTKDSLFKAVYESAVNGLEIGGIRSEAYLVPYGEEVKLIPGYKGLISLVRRTGKLVDVTMECVHEGDRFVTTKGDNVTLTHEPSTDLARESKPITHVYVIFHMTDGSKIRNVWTAAQIDAHRDRYSEAYRRAERYRAECEAKKQPVDEKRLSPWHTSWSVMAYKTLIRDAISRGRLPLSDAVVELASRDDDRGGDVVDAGNTAALTYSDEMDEVLNDFGGDDGVVDQAPKQLEQTEQPPVFGGIQDPVFLKSLEECKTLGHITALKEQATELCQDDEEREYVKQLCTEREEQIRAKRSAK